MVLVESISLKNLEMCNIMYNMCFNKKNGIEKIKDKRKF